MPKRKRGANAGSSSAAASAAAGATFSLMDGKIDVLDGLVMHKQVITKEFEDELISFVEMQCERGRIGELKKPTYLRASGARSQGNQRESIMFGGFFDFNLARPGKRGLVPPFPSIIERLVDHLVSNKYLPSEVRPDSCIINKYGQGDCIPPHVDHSSYYRPISTLSLLWVCYYFIVGTWSWCLSFAILCVSILWPMIHSLQCNWSMFNRDSRISLLLTITIQYLYYHGTEGRSPCW